jgi:hypothetical protein
MQRKKLDPYHSPQTKINLNWIKQLNLNIRPKTMQVLGENGGTNSLSLAWAVVFLAITLKTQTRQTNGIALN